MKEQREHLPVYGVGPYYGISIIILTIAGIIISYMGYLDFGYFPITRIPFFLVGFIVCICGFLVWFKAALRIDNYIKENELCTNGIYSIVRNPCYSGIMLMCSGLLLFTNNVCLLILPLLYWLAMTLLMKNTEEKWLLDLYGESYSQYCKKVNRCIPWFPKKKN